MAKTWLYAVVVLLMPLVLFGCSNENDREPQVKDERIALSEVVKLEPKASAKVFYFGFDLRSSPQEDARQYLPFLKYLERKTGYRFELRFTPKDEKIAENLGKGVIHFAAIGATSYIQASSHYDVVPLVRGLNQHNKAEYRSYLVISKRSDIKKMSDFYGKRLAFGSVTSTQGHLIPRIILAKNDFSLQDFSTYEFTGSHQNCADAVISGKADICGMQDTMAEALVKQDKLKIFLKSDYFPSSGIAATKGLPAEVIKRVKQALIDFDPQGKDASSLYHWDRTEMPNGFTNARDSDYNELRSWMQKLKISVLDTVAKFREFIA